MNNLKVLNQRYESIAWGAIFILLGILIFIPGDQNNVFVLGIGVIFLLLNLVRSLSGIAMNWVTNIVGVVALVLGGVSTLMPVLGYKNHWNVDVFSLIVLAIGLSLLIPGPRKETTE